MAAAIQRQDRNESIFRQITYVCCASQQGTEYTLHCVPLSLSLSLFVYVNFEVIAVLTADSTL